MEQQASASASQPDMFACDGCGKQYRWKAELAGKRVKCKCGQVVRVPDGGAVGAGPVADVNAAKAAALQQKKAQQPQQPQKLKAPPPKPAEDDDGLGDLYALAAEEKKSARSGAIDESYRCPACQQPMEVGSALCTHCGFNVKLGRRATPQQQAAPAMSGGAAVATAGSGPASPFLGYAPRNRGVDEATASDFANAMGGEPIKEIVLPGALALGGLVLQCVSVMYQGGDWLGFADALPQIGVQVLIGLVFCFAGVMIVSKLMEVSLGAPVPMVIKLIAIVLAPPAIANLVGQIVGHDSGFVRMMTSTLVMIPLLWLFFCWLFDMEFGDAIWTTTMVWLVQQWVVIFLMGLIFSGGGGGLGMIADSMGGGGGSSGEPTADQMAAETLSLASTVEAKPWLEESIGRVFGRDAGNGAAKKFVDDVLAAGAKGVHVVKDGPEAVQVIVTLPKDKEQRKKIYEIENKFATDHGRDPSKDEGNKYLVMDFL